MFTTMLRVLEDQQQQIKQMQDQQTSLKDEVGEMAPRLDGLDNQVIQLLSSWL